MDNFCLNRNGLLTANSVKSGPPEAKIFTFTTTTLDTILGRTDWDGLVLNVVNIRNGYKRNMKFTKKSSGDSEG